jgi:hypothetical protein
MAFTRTCRREEKIQRGVEKRVLALSKLMDCNITLEARYRRPGRSDCGMKATVEKLKGV